MNLELVSEMTEKKLIICDAAFVEEPIHLALRQGGYAYEKIREQLQRCM